MTVEPLTAGSAVPAWGRFLLRVAAIAWPALAYWHVATADRGARCAPPLLELLVAVLTVPGVVALVYAANAVGSRQRYALAVASAVAAAWIVTAVLARWVLSSSACGLF